jgi:hypothetical protein
MNCAFSLDTDPATSLRIIGTRARMNEYDLTAHHAISCLRNEHKRLVDESGRLDNANHISCKLNCSQDDVPGLRKLSKPKYLFALSAHCTYNLPNL